MSLNLRIGLAAALTLAACATTRKELGEVAVRSATPLLANQLITEYGFKLESGRVYNTRPRSAAAFDFVVMESGCVRGTADLNASLSEFCPRPGLPDDPPGTTRWRSSNSNGVFTTYLTDGDDTLVVEAGLARGEFRLPAEGEVGAELRRHPVLLGLAFAYGLVPSARGDAQPGQFFEFQYQVASVP